MQAIGQFFRRFAWFRVRPAAGHLFVGIASLGLLASDSLDQDALQLRFQEKAGTVRLDLDAIGPDLVAELDAPATFIEMSEESAREINAGIAFSTLPNPAARPFRFAGDGRNLGRATDCLAAAQYYEAGGDIEGQRAVAQVVLNRVRHPAYPSTVCGVVFQGSERRTGCQFTFTCDGAMRRPPQPGLWQRTMAIAKEALSGEVYAKVGHATHYHTDWVVPVWSGKLEKITNVNTHLFFRWPGGWGRPAAFSRSASGTEPMIARLASISPFHRKGEEGEDVLDLPEPGEEGAALAGTQQAGTMMGLPALPGVNLRGSKLRLAHPQGDAFGFELPADYPGSFALLAYDVCEGRAFCKVMGWTDGGAIPAGFPVSHSAQQSMAFLYIYDRTNRREIMAWDCDRFPRDNPRDCLSDDITRWDAVQQP